MPEASGRAAVARSTEAAPAGGGSAFGSWCRCEPVGPPRPGRVRISARRRGVARHRVPPEGTSRPRSSTGVPAQQAPQARRHRRGPLVALAATRGALAPSRFDAFLEALRPGVLLRWPRRAAAPQEDLAAFRGGHPPHLQPRLPLLPTARRRLALESLPRTLGRAHAVASSACPQQGHLPFAHSRANHQPSFSFR
jgi:hypothetical protein